MAAIFEQSETLKLDPNPGFVVKTRILEGQGDHLYSTKVFINVCHEPRVPKPSTDFDPAVVFPMIVQNAWEIPIIVSLEKRAVDKKGVPSFVYDCCINSECFQWVQVSRDLRSILIEWALESVEMMHELVLEREYALPKMLCKGELSPTEITAEDLKNGLQKKLLELKQNETAGLIEELEGRNSGTSATLGDASTPGELPDLTDIGGKRHRPLIEEIGEMSLDEQQSVGLETRPNTKSVQSKPKADSFPSDESKKGAEIVRYKFAVTQKTQGDHFYVLFESAQLTKQMEVSCSEADRGQTVITFRNLDPERSLHADNRVEIAIPASFTPYKSFLLEKAGQLYVFCKKQN